MLCASGEIELPMLNKEQMNNKAQKPHLHKYSTAIRDKFKRIGVCQAKKAIESAIEISKFTTSNLAMYGKPYRRTLEFACLELAEKVALFKYEFYR